MTAVEGHFLPCLCPSRPRAPDWAQHPCPRRLGRPLSRSARRRRCGQQSLTLASAQHPRHWSEHAQRHARAISGARRGPPAPTRPLAGTPPPLALARDANAPSPLPQASTPATSASRPWRPPSTWCVLPAWRLEQLAVGVRPAYCRQGRAWQPAASPRVTLRYCTRLRSLEPPSISLTASRPALLPCPCSPATRRARCWAWGSPSSSASAASLACTAGPTARSRSRWAAGQWWILVQHLVQHAGVSASIMSLKTHLLPKGAGCGCARPADVCGSPRPACTPWFQCRPAYLSYCRAS